MKALRLDQAPADADRSHDQQHRLRDSHQGLPPTHKRREALVSVSLKKNAKVFVLARLPR